MKIYYHPASTTSRPLMLFAAEEGVNVDFELVDLFTGAHYKDEYTAINPNRLVPVLEDGDFRLTESSAILKYLADKVKSPRYPAELHARARVNERMDWINTQICRDFAYGFVYPQIFPMHKRSSDEAQAATIAWGRERAATWLGVLDRNLLGSENRYLCGSELTIADYFGAALLTCGHPIRTEFKAYPNIVRWLETVDKLPNWRKVNEPMDGFRQAVKDKQFETI